MFFSLIIPFYKPEEVDELLESLSKSDYNEGFEVVIIEDGSSLKCEEVVKKSE
jgi:glycosyltransferase involved in cell wall biosynthesis